MIGKIKDGDIISIDKNNINLEVSENELNNRKIKIPEDIGLNGYLKKYKRNVSGAEFGCVTDI